MPEAWSRDAVSRSHSQGTMVTCVTWDVPFRRELYTAYLLRGSLWKAIQRRHAEVKVSKSWIPKSQTWGTPSLLSRTRVKKKNPSSGQLKARHHRLAHESMALGVEVSESDSLNWEETSTLDAMNSQWGSGRSMHVVLPKRSSGEWRLRQNDSLNERTPGTLDPGRGFPKSGGLSMTTL